MNAVTHGNWKREIGKRTARVSSAPAVLRFPISVFLFLWAFIGVYLCKVRPAHAQEAKEEIVANVSAGRVVLFVAKDSILIAAHSNPEEPDSRPPAVLQIGRYRALILLGAVEWAQPFTGRPPVRLDEELPKFLAAGAGPKLSQGETSDIEGLGLALLEPLRAAAGRVHARLELPADEPLVAMLVVGYTEGYGPEVWLLKYRITQDPLRGDYWQTRVLRPSYQQLYPPEKGQPRALVEVRYPFDSAGPGVGELLVQNDARITRIAASSVEAARAAERLHKGEAHKAASRDAMLWLRPALNAVTPPGAEQFLGAIGEKDGLAWVLPPPKPAPRAEEQKPREPGAPTLRKP
jgi:hypothetical protein